MVVASRCRGAARYVPVTVRPKLELLFTHGMEPGAVEEGWLEAVRADARRLLCE